MITEPEYVKINKEETYQFGMEFPFYDIAMSYDSASVNFASLFGLNNSSDDYNDDNEDYNNSRNYDIVKNNCADFIVAIGNLLGMKNSPELNSFIVKRLMKQYGTELLDAIRRKGSDNIPFLLQHTNNIMLDSTASGSHIHEEEEEEIMIMEDKELLYLLVTSRTSNLMMKETN